MNHLHIVVVKTLWQEHRMSVSAARRGSGGPGSHVSPQCASVHVCVPMKRNEQWDDSGECVKRVPTFPPDHVPR